ncbi:D-alanine--D-alanine ligase family protein [Acidobacteriota bacterium]
MIDQKIRVALIFGGRSAEHEISIMSATSIFDNLDRGKFDVICIYINRDGDWKAVESPRMSQGEKITGEFSSFLPWDEGSVSTVIQADIYFPILHGPFGEDGTIQGLFEMADVAYVGAGVLASSGLMDKATAKDVFKAKGLPIVEHRTLLERDWLRSPSKNLSEVENDFQLPVFVKPANLGSSVGISKVGDLGSLKDAIETAFIYDRKIIIEQGVDAREIECSVLGNDEPRASIPGELFPHREFYDYHDKYIGGKTRFSIPADLTTDITREVQEVAVRAYEALDCTGLARVDFLLEKRTDRIFLNELNTLPGFTEISMYPKLWEASGLPFPKLLEELVELGIDRHKNKKREGIRFQP